MAKNPSLKRGFTIIEVVLVLAIGGLIFLMVFIALPALQRSQRNSQRRDDMARVMTAVIEYQKHNSDNTPFYSESVGVSSERIDQFVMRYLDTDATEYHSSNGVATGCTDAFKDPDGTCYAFLRSSASISNSLKPGDAVQFTDVIDNKNPHVIVIADGVKCRGEENTAYVTSGKNNIAILYGLEGGGTVCVDNS